MNYKRLKMDSNNYIKICILIFLIIISISPFFVAKADSVREQAGKSHIYIKLINYTLPIAKVTTDEEEHKFKFNSSIKEQLLSSIGIELTEPLSILGKEVACLNNHTIYNRTSNNKNKSEFNVPNSFNLKDDFIFNENVKENNENSKSDELNIPNKIASVYDQKLKKKLDISKPEVFIYHTHTMEAYSPPINGDYFTEDENKNMCSVGNAIAYELEENYGVAVIHDKTIHDAQAYKKSYERSGITMDKYFKKYKDFRIVIDLHRDSVGNSKSAVTTKINGEYVAKFMFVMTKKNPHFKKNMELAMKLKNISDNLYPGLCRGIDTSYDYGTKYFNQDKSNNAILIEVGADCNTTEEAKATGKYLARIMAEYLNGKN